MTPQAGGCLINPAQIAPVALGTRVEGFRQAGHVVNPVNPDRMVGRRVARVHSIAREGQVQDDEQ